MNISVSLIRIFFLIAIINHIINIELKKAHTIFNPVQFDSTMVVWLKQILILKGSEAGVGE